MKLFLYQVSSTLRSLIESLLTIHFLDVESVLEAEEEAYAISLIKQYKPEIIIMEMQMSAESLTNLLAFITTTLPASQFIVIGDENHISPLRGSTSSRTIDYLATPIHTESLYPVLARAISAKQPTSQTRQPQLQQRIEFNEMRPYYWDKLLTRLVHEGKHPETISYLLTHQFHMPLETRLAHIALMDSQDFPPDWFTRFAGDLELLQFALLNMCNECLGKSKSGVAFRHWYHKQEILMFVWKSPAHRSQTHFSLAQPSHHYVSPLYQEIHRSVQICFGYRLHIGIGETVSFPDQLLQSYHSARTALRQRNLLDRISWCHLPIRNAKPYRLQTLFQPYTERLQFALQSSNHAQIEEIITTWLAQATLDNALTREQIDFGLHAVRHWLITWKEEFLPTEKREDASWTDDFPAVPIIPTTLPLDNSGALDLIAWKQQIIAPFLELAHQIAHTQRKENKIIYEICAYIDKHYNQHLSLQEISKLFFISREYISRKFKQEFNINFVDYLSRIRIEKSKKLLTNPHLRIAQIAEQVGYLDEKYFSKVFKKMTGISPKQFRQQQK